MTTGLSGTYSIQATDILQPTVGRWIEKDSFGIDGNSHVIYSAVRSFELNWQLMTTSDFKQIVDYYNTVSNTGTVAVDLPQFGAAGFQFNRYSGCVLAEPSIGEYFNGYVQDVRLLITNIV
jgi:hypothetical protein